MLNLSKIVTVGLVGTAPALHVLSASAQDSGPHARRR
jgi:hypothetical protein